MQFGTRRFSVRAVRGASTETKRSSNGTARFLFVRETARRRHAEGEGSIAHSMYNPDFFEKNSIISLCALAFLALLKYNMFEHLSICYRHAENQATDMGIAKMPQRRTDPYEQIAFLRIV